MASAEQPTPAAAPSAEPAPAHSVRADSMRADSVRAASSGLGWLPTIGFVLLLFVVGFGPAGDTAAQLLAHSALQSVVHVAGDIAGGTMVAAVGDTALSSTASGISYIEAKFRNMQAAFTARRLAWLLERLSEHLWGGLLDGLRAGTELPRSAEFQQAEEALRTLRKQLRQVPEVAGKTA